MAVSEEKIPKAGPDFPAAVCRKQVFFWQKLAKNDEIAFYPPKEHFAHLTPENNKMAGGTPEKKNVVYQNRGLKKNRNGNVLVQIA